MIIPLYKPIGPSTHSFVKKYADSIGEVATHTGSLDPMAQGIVVVLTGEDRFRKEQESNAIKEYSFKVLGGFYTDSHDVLGIIVDSYAMQLTDLEAQISQHILSFVGSYSQQVPNFSARRISGESSFDFAKRGELISDMFENVTIMSASVIGSVTLTAQELLVDITDRISHVMGDFRQDEIIQGWEVALSNSDAFFPIVECLVVVSKRMYVRGLVRDVSKQLHIPLTTLSITRTKNGQYSIGDCKDLCKRDSL